MSSTNTIIAADLIAAACGATGLKDFGNPPLFPALELLAKAINEEAHLTDFGLEVRRQHIVRLLANRLRLMEKLKQRPALATAKIGAPLVIVGLPRSGTTKMQRMFSRDKRFNSIMSWENMFPIPLSNDPGDRQTRIQYGAAFCNALREHSPDFYAAHPVDAEEPEEEMVLMQHSLLTESIDAELRIPSYIDWLKTQDMRPMYQQFALWLRVLADEHGKPDAPWLLKGTYHGAHLDALFDVFPDAKVVYCHRDPVETISSYCSLVSKIRSLLSDQVDKHDLGRELLKNWSAHQRKMMAVRERIPAGRILDIPYPQIVNYMPEVVERIYAFANVPLTDEARAAFAAWELDNSQHKLGRHEYKTTDYGISEAEIAAVCAEYRAKYIVGQK